MDFNFSEEQLMLKDGAERYVQQEYGFEARAHIAAQQEGFSRDHWRAYAELGWLGLTLPEDVGGLGCSFVEMAILMEALGRGMVLEPVVQTALLCATLVERGDAKTPRETLLPAVIEGKLLLSLADSEAGSRYTVGCHARTHARKTAAGYLISGAKTLVIAGESADQLLVTARMEGASQGAGVFLVDRRAAGVTCRSYRLLDGSRAADIDLHNVEVGADALIAGSDRALDVLTHATDLAILASVAESLGMMEAVMAITAEYIKGRSQFGQPIGKFQALQHRMAEMFVATQEARSMLYCGIAHLDRPAAERSRAISAAKAVAARANRFVCAQGIQLHGGMGLTEEYPVGHYFRKMTMMEKMFGDIDFHLDRVAASNGKPVEA
ncbi:MULTISPECIES: acyl-CoA dehydrogenase family protein [Burkholderia cepacia complex]|uniref:Acyl-CoA dehydrogenase domain protein n=1 Tax=Burkholderia orbicola (strain MC0-3) TaxID=406425 RepID=B1KCN8_BURO0|nr:MULTISPECIES: acyl-CoA dehydrogenase family protein [Burkholderia cepacia complex]ACA95985.1 acyl-CoA dehydrogenase domain protein [Burkholderia orbicola MC0-3]KWU23678.1 acyl-CoA dehydrogenase [Burkholderia cenocepacia]MBY4798477.1 acyl-CoA dehydrogenase family protein [Burkholderia cepacia]MCA8088061.1 acyl-CoA dehydrogenase family protein [Burkholderia cenocepacia]CAG2361852.1 acyl-CoA dehydrogenase [Burkholderia cenocepacia]